MGAYDCDCINNLEYDRRERKAQLSKEGTTKGATSDLISRQAAIDALKHNQDVYSHNFHDDPIDKYTTAIIATDIDTLVNLPTIQPEPQEGHWIPHESPDGDEQYECSRCGVLWEFVDGTPEDNEAYFCPKCGKKLITK